MKTIPVSLIVAGFLVPVIARAQAPGGPPPAPPAAGEPDKDKRGRPPRAFMEAWKKADRDHDGFISRVEFDQMPRIQQLPEEKRSNLFRRLDKNGDGRLGRDELTRAPRPFEGGQPGPPTQRFWELDVDRSGGVSFAEFQASQVFKKLPPERQREVFRRLDTNKDGTISPDDKPEPPFQRKPGPRPPHHPDE